MNVPGVLGILTLVVAVPLNWYIVLKLWRLSLAQPQLHVLRERAIAALFIAILLTVFALIFLNNDLVPPPVPFDETKLLTRSAMFAAGVIPAGYWLWLYR